MQTPEATWLSLGSNEGDRGGALRAALAAIHAWPETRGLRASNVYETAYVGGGAPQRDYWNLCVHLVVDLDATRLHARAQALEGVAGRRPGGHGRPRPLDVDLLTHHGLVLRTEALTLPHPRIAERRFVLEPLLELEAGLRLPDGSTVRERWRAEPIQRQRVHRLGPVDLCRDRTRTSVAHTVAEVGR